MTPCYSLAVLTMLLMVVTPSPLVSPDSQECLTLSSTILVYWTLEQRQLHLGPQSTMVPHQYLDGISPPRPLNIEVIGSTATESPSLPSSTFTRKNPSEIKSQQHQVATQDSDSTKANFLGPVLPGPAVPWSLPTKQQATPPTASPVSGCTTTVMGDLRNPCLRSPEWTSTVTQYNAVDCHGCASVHVIEPRWHCPAVITTERPLTASGPSTLTSTVCASTSALSELVGPY